MAVSGGWFCGIFLALLAAAAILLLLADVPPLFDYPNHLARMYLLGRLSESGSLQHYYALEWAPIPDLGMDLVVPVLARVLPLAWAAKLCLLATMALIAAGTAGVHRVVNGRWTLWPLGAFFFLYSRVLLWGFLNFLFGVGLALTGLAAWIALAERPAWQRLVVGASFAFGAYFAHLMAAIVFGVLTAGYELGRCARLAPMPRRAVLARATVIGLAFAAPVTLFLIGPHEGLGAIRFGRWVRKLDLPFSVFDDYHRVFDIGSFVLLFLVAGFLFARRYLVVMAPLRLPLFLLLLLYLAAPAQIMTASAVDHRLPLVLALVLVAATAGPTMPTQWARGAAIFALALFVVRLGLVGEAWMRADAVYRRDISVIDRIPENARVALAYPPSAIAVDLAPKAHLPLLAIIRRDAFIPTLFAYPGQQPVALTPLGATLAAEAEPGMLWQAWNAADAGAMTAALRDFDFFVALDRRPLRLPAVTALEPVAGEPDFALYRVRRGSP